MKINGVNISNFGAQLLKYEVGDSDKDVSVEWSPKGLTPLKTIKQPKFKPLSITLIVEAETRAQLEKNKSLLSDACKECTIIFPKDDLEYVCLQTGPAKISRITDLAINMTLELKCFVTEPYHLINLQKSLSQSVNIKGNSRVEVVYTITTKDALGSFTIQGITVNNLPANSVTVIDGEKKTIKTNGLNKFADSDLVEFPTLPSGNITIKISSVLPAVTINYKPRWA